MPFTPLIRKVRETGFTFNPPERVHQLVWAMPGVEKYDPKSQVIWRFTHHGFNLNFTYFKDHKGRPHVRMMATRPSVHKGEYFVGGFEIPEVIDLSDIRPGMHVQLVLDEKNRIVGGTESTSRFEKKATKENTEIVLEKSQEVAATKATVNNIENLLRQVAAVSEERKGTIFPEEPKTEYALQKPWVRFYRLFVREKHDSETLELIREAKARVLSLLEHVKAKPLR